MNLKMTTISKSLPANSRMYNHMVCNTKINTSIKRVRGDNIAREIFYKQVKTAFDFVENRVKRS